MKIRAPSACYVHIKQVSGQNVTSPRVGGLSHAITKALVSLTLVQNEGHVALGHLVALLSQQQILDQRRVRLALLEAAVGPHEAL